MTKCQERSIVVANSRLQGDYYQIDFETQTIATSVEAGQFVHVQLPGFEHRVLRRPFSIFNVEEASGVLSVVYKVVGEGTRHLSGVSVGTAVDLMGPLGRGYTPVLANEQSIVVAGGYGCAATYLFARRSPAPPMVLLGGRSAGDILLTDRFRDLGCDVRISTDDGSRGCQGLVTELLQDALAELTAPAVVACGPNAMLRAVARIAGAKGVDAQVSLDHLMCCGVGACFACVMKMKADNADGWEYIRTCKEGPVFPASRVCWDD